MKEFQFLDIIKKTITDSSYIGDDTAFWEGFAVTQDTMVEDVHFRLKNTSPQELGKKVVAINFSDLAAAGATPLFILVSLSLPAGIPGEFVQGFYEGVNSLCDEFGAKILGGDLTGGDKVSITLTAVGKAASSIKRSSARAGDVVFVTGEHGNSRAGLEILEKRLPCVNKFLNAHKTPTPRVKEGLSIAQMCDNPAMMDTSDGLADALFKVATSSGVTLQIDFDKIPFDADLQQFSAWKSWILYGGEDFELLACARPSDFEKIKDNLAVFQIGQVVEAESFPVIIKDDGAEIGIDLKSIENMAFDHFMGESK